MVTYAEQIAKINQTQQFISTSKSLNLGQKAFGFVKRTDPEFAGPRAKSKSGGSNMSVIPSSVILGPRTILAQQNLSEAFGIPTFNLTGDISTVPKLRELSGINVGVGMFTGETAQSFTLKLAGLLGQAKVLGGQIGNTIFNPPEFAPGNTTGGTSNSAKDSASGSASTTDRVIESLDQFKNTIGPIGIIIGLGILGIVLLSRR